MPDGSIFTRLEIVSQGFSHEMINGYGKQPWICTSRQIALLELKSLDPMNEAYYKAALYNNGVTTLPMIKGMKSYAHNKHKFDADWTPLASMWTECGMTMKLQWDMSMRQHEHWTKEIAVQRTEEHVVLGNAVYAAWIAVLSENESIANEAYSIFEERSGHIAWESLHLPMAYPAECIFIARRLLQSK